MGFDGLLYPKYNAHGYFSVGVLSLLYIQEKINENDEYLLYRVLLGKNARRHKKSNPTQLGKGCKSLAILPLQDEATYHRLGYFNRDLKIDKGIASCFLAKSAALGNERAKELFYALKKDGKL